MLPRRNAQVRGSNVPWYRPLVLRRSACPSNENAQQRPCRTSFARAWDVDHKWSNIVAAHGKQWVIVVEQGYKAPRGVRLDDDGQPEQRLELLQRQAAGRTDLAEQERGAAVITSGARTRSRAVAALILTAAVLSASTAAGSQGSEKVPRLPTVPMASVPTEARLTPMSSPAGTAHAPVVMAGTPSTVPPNGPGATPGVDRRPPPATFDPRSIAFAGDESGAVGVTLNGGVWVGSIDGSDLVQIEGRESRSALALRPRRALVELPSGPSGGATSLLLERVGHPPVELASDIGSNEVLSADGRRVYFVRRGSQASPVERGVWRADLATLALTKIAPATTAIRAMTLAVSQDGRSVALSGDPRGDAPTPIYARFGRSAYRHLRDGVPIGFACDGRLLIGEGDGTGAVIAYDPATRRYSAPIAPEGYHRVTPDGRSLVTFDAVSTVRVRDLVSGSRTRVSLATVPGSWGLTDLGASSYAVFQSVSDHSWAIVDLSDHWVGYLPPFVP
jgi:hypothetical protein